MNTTETLPAGLLDNNIELFTKNNEVFVLQNGIVVKYEDSIDTRMYIQNDINEHLKEAMLLMNKFNIEGVEFEKKWAACRFGGFNNVADINTTTATVTTEYVDCHERNTCGCSGHVCKIPANLTTRELDTIKALSSGEPAKNACKRAGIRFNTYKSYLKSIYIKTNSHNMAGVVGFAKTNNLI